MFSELKERVFEANRLIPEHRLSVLTWGNASEIDRQQGVFAIKPSGVSYAALRPQNIVLVDLEGRLLENNGRPSTDTPTHLQLYLSFPDIGGIVHAHSPFATVFAQAGMEIPCYGTTHADTFFGSGAVTRRLTRSEIECDYEKSTGEVIAECLREKGLSPLEMAGVLVHSHAPFVWGKNVAQALENGVVLENTAEMALLSRSLNPDIRPIDGGLLEKHFLRKHGATAYYGQL